MPNWEEVLNEINHEQIKGSPADTIRWRVRPDLKFIPKHA